jgi:hypothetical protein
MGKTWYRHRESWTGTRATKEGTNGKNIKKPGNNKCGWKKKNKIM